MYSVLLTVSFFWSLAIPSVIYLHFQMHCKMPHIKYLVASVLYSFLLHWTWHEGAEEKTAFPLKWLFLNANLKTNLILEVYWAESLSFCSGFMAKKSTWIYNKLQKECMSWKIHKLTLPGHQYAALNQKLYKTISFSAIHAVCLVLKTECKYNSGFMQTICFN